MNKWMLSTVTFSKNTVWVLLEITFESGFASYEDLCSQAMISPIVEALHMLKWDKYMQFTDQPTYS